MAWNTPTSPVSGTVITVAWATSNIVEPLVHLRLLTGNADPPGSNYVVVSTGTAGTSWQKVPGDAIGADAIGATHIQAGAVGNSELATNAVATANIQDDAVTLDKMADNSVSTGQIVNGSVGTDELSAGAVTRVKIGANAVGSGEIEDGSVGSAEIATGAVGSDEIASLAVTSAKLATDAVIEEKIADGAVADDKLKAGAVVGHLGYTPLNKAGDTGISGNLVLNNLVAINGRETPGGNERNLVYMGSGNRVSVGDAANDLTLFGGASPEYKTVSNTYTLLHSGNLSGFLPAVGAYVPSGAVVWFETLAELTAAGAGWARYTAADGRLLVGAGTTFSQTFTEATNYGSAWSHTHTTPNHQHGSLSLSVSGSAVGGPGDSTGGPSATDGLGNGGGTTTPTATHNHSLNGVSLAVSGTATGSTGTDGGGTSGPTSWLPPSRAGVWGRKS